LNGVISALFVVATVARMSPAQPSSAGVGFRVVEAPDSARQYRTSGGTIPRPIHVMLWYPAGAANGTKLHLRDYVRTPGSRNDRGSRDALTHERAARNRESGPIDAVAFENLVSRLVPAMSGVAPAPGRHPTLVLEAGLNAPAHLYSALAESLAARGFVVAAIPSFGGGDGEALAFDSTGLATQLVDIERTLQVVRGLPFVDSTRVAVGAWSVGALPALAAASSHPALVKAFVSLDGAVGYDYGVGLASQIGLRTECIRTPFLHMTGTRPALFRVPKSRHIFESLMGPNAYWATVPGLSHGDFTSYYGTRAPGFQRRVDRQSVEAGSRQVIRLTSAFLLKYLGLPSTEWKSILERDPIEELKADSSRAACSATAPRS